jgi:hypothetical protein
MLWLAVVLFLTLIDSVLAANHYIRDGGSASTGGTGLCTSWETANACDDLPTTLIRGDTYYIADGAYAARTFNTGPQTGGATITIKKATGNDHGTETGWLSTYGDGQATFVSWNFDTSNWTMDGVTRNESDWFDRTAYGFVVGTGGSQTNQIDLLNCSAVFHNIAIKYTAVRGYDNFAGLPTGSDIGAYAIHSNSTGCTDAQYTGLLFQRMLVQGGVNQWLIRNSTGTIIEYSAGEDTIGNSGNHGDTINAYYSVQNMIVRYNKFRNLYTSACSNCGSTGWIPYCCGSGGLEVYGNTVYNFRGGDGYVGYTSCSPSNCPSNSKIYNNTFDGCSSGTSGQGGIYLGNGSSNVAYNNIWMNCTTIVFEGVTHNFNAYQESNGHSESNVMTSFATSNFVNYAAQDYRLQTGTTAGTSLASPYNTDPLGTTRGADGTFDRGAYEFGGAPPDTTPPAAPGNVHISRLLRP